MARNTVTNTGPKKSGKKPSSGSSGENRTLVLLLAGFTGLVILAMAAFAVLSASGGGGSGDAGSFTPNNQGLIPVGERVPGFTAQTVEGGSVSVGQGGGAGATMLVFFATWCPHCQREAPIISELESQYDGLKVVMVGIDGQDNPGKVREFADEYDIESPAIYEPSLGSEYRISGYPTAYVLNGAAEVVAAHSGEAPREAYEGWIEEALG